MRRALGEELAYGQGKKQRDATAGGSWFLGDISRGTSGRHWGRYLKRSNRRKKSTQGTYKIPKPAAAEQTAMASPIPKE